MSKMVSDPMLPSWLSSDHLLSLPSSLYPWFDVCHIIICIIKVREECGRQFAFNHPLATLVSCIIASFAGSLIVNPLLGKPILQALANEQLLSLTILIFAAIFYAPADIFNRFLQWQPVWIGINALKEIYRGKKIYDGIFEGSKAVPSSLYFVPVLIGVIKGNGYAFITPLARAVRGQLRLEATELMNVSVSTKECILAAWLFVFVGMYDDILYLSLLGFFLSVRLSAIIGRPFDPFAPFVNFVFGILDRLAPSAEKAKSVKKD